MTLAAGGLALSLGFTKDLVRSPCVGSVTWIHWGWTLLAGSLVVALLSLLASQQAILGEIRNIDSAICATGAPGTSRWGSATLFCNVVSTAMLLGGLACVVRFAVLNYGG